MKNLKLGIFAVALVVLGAVVFQSKDASAANGTVSLTVTGAAGSCSYGTSVVAPMVSASFSDQSTTGTFSSAFVCTGTSAGNSTLSIQATTSLAGPNGNTIPAANVSANIGSYTSIAGDATCLVPVTITGSTYAAIDTVTTMLSRQLGKPCVLKADTVKLAVLVPANSPVGDYSGTLVFTETNW